MFSEEQIFYNALNIVLKSNFRKIREAYERCGSFKGAFESIDSFIDPEFLIKDLEKNNIKMVVCSEKGFPKRLLSLPDNPLGLYFLGSMPYEICVSIVGTRKPSLYGSRQAFNIAKELGVLGFGVVSGLAHGIDTTSHLGTLEGGGKTYAVLAQGLSFIYPRENEALAKKIIKAGGGIISEYPVSGKIEKYRFLERNRITSGLSSHVIIIEAPKRSGSLSTVSHALEQGSNIYVVPGEVSNESFSGSHGLIRDGARLITSVNDFLDDLDNNLT